ncbi:MAG: phosphatase PAP2 family protein [Actinomycetota bacterium]
MSWRRGRQDPGGPRQAAPAGQPLLAQATAIVVLAASTGVTVALGALFFHQHHPSGLDVAIDGHIKSVLGSHPRFVLDVVNLGQHAPVAIATIALTVACLAARRWRGALLAAVTTPAAAVLTDHLLKQLSGRTYGIGSLTYPSGHATVSFTLAAVVALLLLGPQRPRIPAAPRVLAVLAVYAVCAAQAVCLVAINFHYFTDTIGGAGTGTAVVMAAALVLDFPGRRHRAVPAQHPEPEPASQVPGPRDRA